jgi:tetratricopeptide (TPR) repeat protein
MDITTRLDSAQALYDTGKYSEAIELLTTGRFDLNSEAAYNIGNCYTRLGELGEARLFFERALLLNPNNADARHNLDWVQLRLSDAIADPTQSLDQWFSLQLRGFMLSEGWLIAALLFLVASTMLLALRKWKNPMMNWRWPFTSTVLGIAFIGLAWWSAPKSNLCIATAPSTYGYSEPFGQGKRILLLSEGSAAQLRKSSEGWFFLELGDGRLAWFDAAQWGRVLPTETTF